MCGTYFNARASRDESRGDTKEPTVSLGSIMSPRPLSQLALALKYAFLRYEIYYNGRTSYIFIDTLGEFYKLFSKHFSSLISCFNFS